MNRSYSKIRHMQESNIIFESRRLNQLLKEETESVSGTNMSWNTIYSQLKGVDTPKIISWTDSDGKNTSLNWGIHKGPGYDWGMSINNSGTFSFQSKNTETYKMVADLVKNYGFSFRDTGSLINFGNANSDPKKLVDLVNNILKSVK